jgi:hypothetical protein
MTITNQNSSVTLTGNAVTTVWPYSFIIPDAASARVGLFDIATSVLTELSNTVYSITGLGASAGGEVTYPLTGSPIAATKRLVIWRALALTQDTNLTNQTPYYPETLEEQLDRLVMMIQQLNEEVNRALKVTQGAAIDPDAFIEELQLGAAVATAQAAIATAQAASASASAALIQPIETQIIALGAVTANITTVADNIALMQSVAGSLPISIDKLSDVDIVTVAPVTGEGLVWAATKFVPGPAGGGMFRGNNGVVGSRSGDIFRINAKTLTANVTIGATENASVTGPLEIATGVTLEVATGGTLVIL